MNDLSLSLSRFQQIGAKANVASLCRLLARGRLRRGPRRRPGRRARVSRDHSEGSRRSRVLEEGARSARRVANPRRSVVAEQLGVGAAARRQRSSRQRRLGFVRGHGPRRVRFALGGRGGAGCRCEGKDAEEGGG